MAKSIIGFHYSIGGNKNGIGAFMEKLNQNGIPFLMKGTDDAGLCFEGQALGQQHGVENYLIYRLSTTGQNNGIEYDVPDYLKSPKEAAQEHFDKTAVKWPPELDRAVVWMEPVNEIRAKLGEGDVQWGNMHPVDWIGFFMLEYALIANGQGWKVCGPSFNSGEPEVFGTNEYELPGMLAYLQYCAANPGKAALSMHEYGGGKLSDYPVLWGRAEGMIAAADKNGIPRTFPIFMTEWGTGDYHDAPRWPAVKAHWDIFNAWAARWPQVQGVGAWTLQSKWGGISDDLQTWFGPLADYTVAKEFDEGPQPAKTHAAFGNTLPGDNDMPDVPYVVVVDLLPQDAALWEKRWVVEQVHVGKETVLQSADDAARLVAPGKVGSKVKVWGAERWTGGDIVQWLKDKGVTEVEVLDLPETSPFSSS